MDPKSHPFHKSVTPSRPSPYCLLWGHWDFCPFWPTDCQHHTVVLLWHIKSCDPTADFSLNLTECQSPTNEQPGLSQSVSSFLSAFLIPSLGPTLTPRGLCTGSSLCHRVFSQSPVILRLTSFPLAHYRHPHSLKCLSVPVKATLVPPKTSPNHLTSSNHKGSFAGGRHSFGFRKSWSKSAGLSPYHHLWPALPLPFTLSLFLPNSLPHPQLIQVGPPF